MSEHPHTELTAYLDQELDVRQHAALEAHLQECPACRAELDEQLALRQLLEALPPAQQQTTTAQFWLDLEPQLQPRRTRLGLAWLWGFVLAAAVVIIQSFFIALRLATILDAAGWLPALQTPTGLSNLWSAESLLGVVQSLFWHNSLIIMALVISLLPYLLTLIVSSILALIFLGWAYAYLCSQSTIGCQQIRE